MAKKKNKRDEEWADAKRLCRLSAEDVRMAKELGMSPRSLIKNRPNANQRWKQPVNLWIQELYAKMKKKQASKQRQSPPVEPPLPTAEEQADFAAPPFGEEEPIGDSLVEGFDEDFEDTGPPDDRAVARQNEALLRRQREFRTAAEYVARELATLPEVQKVVLFGSVAAPLVKEVPRFREFRRAGIAVWHECKDVDLAVWLTSLDDLKSLQCVRSRAVNQLHADKNIGVAHHQVEIFVMAPETNGYLGRLCGFGTCPKEGKMECFVPHCGEHLFLRQIPTFELRPDALQPERTVVLFERATDSPPSFGV